MRMDRNCISAKEMADKAKPHLCLVHQANRSSHNHNLHREELNAGLNQTAHYRSPLRKAPQNREHARTSPRVLKDYLGEAGIGTVRYKSFKNPGQDAPIISAGCGVIDICGKLRPEVQWNRLIWGLDHTPGIGVEPYTHAGETGSESMWRDTDAVASWSWAGCEGKKPRSRSTLTAKRRNSLSTGIPMAEKRRRNTRLSLNTLSMSPVPSPQSATMAREKNRAALP